MIRQISLYFDKITVGFVDGFGESKGVIVLFQDLTQVVDLVFIDDTHQHGFLVMTERTKGGHTGGAVVQHLNDLPGDLLGMGGDDGEFTGGLGATDNIAAYKAGDETVEDTQAHRLVIVNKGAIGIRRGIYKERGNSHQHIEYEGHIEEIQLRTLLADISGNDIRTAGGGIQPGADAVNKAADDTAEYRGKNGIVASRIILQIFQTQLLQVQEREGIYKAEDQGAHSKPLIDKKPRDHAKRDIDDQGHIADAEAGFILEHGGDAVESRGSESVLYDKKLIIEGQQQRDGDDAQVRDGFL